MKKLTEREFDAVQKEFERLKENFNTLPGSHHLGEMFAHNWARSIANAIDQAEGFPEPPEDKYKEAKKDVESKILALNQSITKCDDLKIKLEIQVFDKHTVKEIFNKIFSLKSASVTL